MMSPTAKRILFIVIAILGAAGIGFAIWFMLRSPKAEPTPTPVVEPEPVTPVSVPRLPVLATSTRTAPSPDSAEEQERKAREALFRRAKDVVARGSTYSSVDQFAAIQQVYIDVTPEVKTFLEAEREALLRDRAGSGYAQTTRPLAARLEEEVMVRTATDVVVEVDAQRLIEQNGGQTVSLVRAMAAFTRRGEAWVMTRLTWDQVDY